MLWILQVLHQSFLDFKSVSDVHSLDEPVLLVQGLSQLFREQIEVLLF